jgi:dihydrofolate synthase/folylpolyglutamate synthase
LLEILGNPHHSFRSFHVAGTNGKGSVCATLEAILRARGFVVGKYTSPHLVDFRERVTVNGQGMDAEYVVEFVDRWIPEIERIGATFFEATTAMAFAYFAARQVDVAVVETGMGGRLDATNVVLPLAAGVSSIGIDHVEFLGHTRHEIAPEKAGIFKAGVPAVIGEPDSEIAELLERLALERKAIPFRVWRECPPTHVSVDGLGTSFEICLGGESAVLRTPLAGEHQASNTATALAMLFLAGNAYYGGLLETAGALQAVRLPGRFHRWGAFIFDVAHNPDGARVLAATIEAVGVRRPLVTMLSVLGDKDWIGVMENLARVTDRFVLTNAPTAPTSRAWSLDAALAYARSRGWDATAEPDFDRALEASRGEGATVLVTGSFHTVGDAMARLQVDPLKG